MGSFSEIIMSSELSKLPKINVEETPSRIHGLDSQAEKDLRILGCEWIQTAGILLRLPQVAMATGQILFQRFYYSKSFIRYDMEITVISCIYLAAKIEEHPRMIGDVLNVFHHMKQIRNETLIAPLNVDQSLASLKEKVMNVECLILKVLGFCVHVKHPHKLILMYLQVLGFEKNKKFMQCAWNYMNDSLRTDVFVRYQPETIACACIYLAGRTTNTPLPNNPPWYEIFKVTESDIIDICYRVSALYHRSKPNVEQLELTVQKLKTEYMEARDRIRLERNSQTTITASINGPSTVATVDKIRCVESAVHETKPASSTDESDARSRSKTSSRNYKKKSSRSPRSSSYYGTVIHEIRKRSHHRSRSRTSSRRNNNNLKNYTSSSSSSSYRQTITQDVKPKSKTERSRSRSKSRTSSRNNKKSTKYASSTSSSSSVPVNAIKSSRCHSRSHSRSGSGSTNSDQKSQITGRPPSSSSLASSSSSYNQKITQETKPVSKRKRPQSRSKSRVSGRDNKMKSRNYARSRSLSPFKYISRKWDDRKDRYNGRRGDRSVIDGDRRRCMENKSKERSR